MQSNQDEPSTLEDYMRLYEDMYKDAVYDYGPITTHYEVLREGPIYINPTLCEEPTAGPSTESIQPITYIPAPQNHPEVKINGRTYQSLYLLKLSSTVQDIKIRIDNDFQRFRTREGEDLFIPGSVLKKIDFEKIQHSKRKRLTVRLPDNFEAQVHVTKVGNVTFHHYRKIKPKQGKNTA